MIFTSKTLLGGKLLWFNLNNFHFVEKTSSDLQYDFGLDPERIFIQANTSHDSVAYIVYLQ